MDRLAPVSTAAATRYDDCLSASWLSARLAIDVARIDAMRRSGELLAVRPPGSTEWLYPGWQFSEGAPRPVIQRIAAVARERGLDDDRLYEVLTMRAGLGRRGGPERRLADLIVAGEDEQVIAAVRSAAPA
jgi:hypothetical protein